MAISSKEHNIKSGDVMVCKPNQLHILENNGNEPVETLVFKISREEGDTYW